MLKSTDVAAVKKQVQQKFNEEPDVFVRVSGNTVVYNVMIYAPYCNNMGTGSTLQAAYQNLVDLNTPKH